MIRSTSKPYSLAKRLTLRLALFISLVWLGTSAGVAWYLNKEVTEAFDAALSESAQRVLTLAAHEINETDPPKHNASVGTGNEVHVENDYLMYQVVDTQGQLLLRSIDAPEQPLPVRLETGFSDTAELRVFTLKHPIEPFFIHMADPQRHRLEARQEVLLWFFLPLLAVLPLLIALLSWALHAGLKPLAVLAARIDEKGSHDLTPVMNAQATAALPSELGIIASNTNQLLLRLNQALDVERALAAHAAHELRTPLAAAQMQLALALSQNLPLSASAPLQKAMNALTVLSRRTEKLLQMSRAQAAGVLHAVPVDLQTLASHVVQDFWAKPGVSGLLHLQLLRDDTAECCVQGDFDTLAIALRNLIENALRYAPNANVWVSVVLPSCISVRDAGQGVDEVRLQALQTQHAQSPASPVGFGLGLSIVKTIMQTHGGYLKLESPALPALPEIKPVGFIASMVFTQPI